MGLRVSSSLLAFLLTAAHGQMAAAQASYRNLDAGFPVRVEDANATERYALDLDFLNFRYDELSELRTRLQYEPRVSYGILPRTEVWVRVPIFYRERTALPRGGIAGVGAGAMYQLKLESLRIPALAIASEIFKPTGPNALPAAYSLRALATRSIPGARIHLNASVASFSVRTGPSLIITCPPPAQPGAGCGGGGGGTLPPLDGPCSIGAPQTAVAAFGLAASLACSSPLSALPLAERQQAGDIETHPHWLLGAAFDKSFPLSSTIVIADFFAEKFEGLGRRTDLTAEVGARHQLRPQVVAAAGVGRHFRGAGQSTFITFGLTLSRAFQP